VGRNTGRIVLIVQRLLADNRPHGMPSKATRCSERTFGICPSTSSKLAVYPSPSRVLLGCRWRGQKRHLRHENQS